MNVEYFGHHYHFDDDLREYTHGKLQKLTKFLDDPVEIRVTVAAEKHRHAAELHVHHRGGQLQAVEEHADVRDALNLVIDKIEKQAERSHSREVDSRRRRDRPTLEQ